MIREIPIDITQPDHNFTVDLEGTVFNLQFRLNSRTSRWHMDVRTEAGVEIVSGIPLVLNYPLLGRFKDVRLPLGEFYVLDNTGANQEPNDEAFGSTHSLVYEESVDG